MTEVAMGLAASVALFIGVILILVRVSKSGGSSIAERDAFKDGEKRRGKFDEETSRPVATGNDLIDRMRNLGR
jgi:hypothetical protein